MIVIVDPVSSGTELAPAFKARGMRVVAVRSSALADAGDVGYARGIHTEDFEAVYDGACPRTDVTAVVAGSETGVALADTLAARLTPHRANATALSSARRNKADMQRALARAGLPTIRTLSTASHDEAAEWVRSNGLTSFVLKPPASSGSDNVTRVMPGDDWQRTFDRILAQPTALDGERSATVLVQELLTGTEYAVDTVSAAGTHTLAHLIRYSKSNFTVFEHTEFVKHDAQLFDFTQRALDALGIRWGAAHAEVMLTANGPRIIEVGARMCGGPVLGFARAATGSSQLERVVEAYVDGAIGTCDYTLKQTVVPVFLKARQSGTLRNIEVMDTARALPTHLASHLWLRNGAHVKRTVDFDSTLGIIALAGPRDAVFADYAQIRAAEAQLQID